MPATFGAGSMPSGATLPGDGLLRGVSKKESVETYSYRDATGETKVLLPGKVKTTETSIDFYGAADLSTVAAGSFTAGTNKVISAKTSESNEGVPEGSYTLKSFSSL